MHQRRDWRYYDWSAVTVPEIDLNRRLRRIGTTVNLGKNTGQFLYLAYTTYSIVGKAETTVMKGDKNYPPSRMEQQRKDDYLIGRLLSMNTPKHILLISSLAPLSNLLFCPLLLRTCFLRWQISF